MEPNTKLVVLTLVLALTLTAETAQGICGVSYAGLYSCKPYVQTHNPLTTPIDHSGPCCSALKPLTTDNFQCLCRMKSSTLINGIDFGLASKLPEKCGITAPSC